jgi:small basic protein
LHDFVGGHYTHFTGFLLEEEIVASLWKIFGSKGGSINKGFKKKIYVWNFTTIVSRICCPVLDIVPKPLWIEYTWTKVIYLQLSDHTLLNDILENKIYFSSWLVQLVLFSLWVLNVTSTVRIPMQVSAVLSWTYKYRTVSSRRSPHCNRRPVAHLVTS